MRILAGVGAWLLGAGTATAGSLLAVSLLGQGIAASPGQQLTEAAVNRALSHETTEASEGSAPTTSRPAVAPSGAPRPAPRRSLTQPARKEATPAPDDSQPAATGPDSQPSASPAAQPAAGTVLNSQGGTVLAQCRAAGAYLVSWSPTQGYEADGVVRGPAARARVIFTSDANSVTIVVSCPAGAAGEPTASSSVQGGGNGTDD